MANSISRFLLTSAVALSVALPATASPAAAFDATERAEIEAIVRDYLITHPEVLLEAQDALQAKQAAEQREKEVAAIAQNDKAIFDDPADPVLGNPEGSATIVEFFDYNCGFCKRALSDMVSMMESDSELRFVLKEFPILGPESQEAHRVAIAFNELYPDKYTEFHLRLLSFDGRANDESAMRIAKELGGDETALRARMEDVDKTTKLVNATYGLANALGITGTPSYVIGDEVVSGAMGESVLATKVANVRQCGSTIC